MTTKTLHVCNLANVAYGYCKILRERGHDVDLRCHDLKHIMSQPEWDDLDLQADDFPEEFDFYDNTADFGDYRRPEWFVSCGIFPSPDSSIPTTNGVAADVSPRPPSGPSRGARLGKAALTTTKKLLPYRVKSRLRPAYKRASFLYKAWRSGEPAKKLITEYRDVEKRCFREIAAQSESYGDQWNVTREMMSFYQPHAWWLRRHCKDHEVIFAYVMSPIYAMLMADKPYVGIEIGTMRDIPFDGSDCGRLLAMAYRRAHHILITNPDVVEHAQRLGLERYSFCPHPLNEDVYAPTEGESDLRRQLKAEHDAEFLMFAPARQNWAIKGNDRYFRAFAQLIKQDVKALLLVPGWGQEVERSRRLCRELGIDHRVRWLSPQSEPVLVKYYQACDLVLDQFILGVFGLITPKAMSCGACVLTSYDRSKHDWCFDEHPPLAECSTEAEIFQAMHDLWRNPDRRRDLARASREWVCGHHSKRIVEKRLCDAALMAKEEFRCQVN